MLNIKHTKQFLQFFTEIELTILVIMHHYIINVKT